MLELRKDFHEVVGPTLEKLAAHVSELRKAQQGAAVEKAVRPREEARAGGWAGAGRVQGTPCLEVQRDVTRGGQLMTVQCAQGGRTLHGGAAAQPASPGHGWCGTLHARRAKLGKASCR